VSTWHQLQGTPVPLWHESKWTVVDDKSNCPLVIVRCDDAKSAEDMAEKTGGYVIPPHLPLDPKRKYGKKV
jgi:hypothetical protein